MLTFLCSVFKWYATFSFVFLKGSSCTLLLSAGLSVHRKGSETNEFYPGTVTLHVVLHFICMKSFHLKTCCFEHMNMWEKSQHISKQANCLAAFFFFYPANDCSFLFSFCKQLSISVHHVIYFFNNLLGELSAVTNRSYRLPYSRRGRTVKTCSWFNVTVWSWGCTVHHHTRELKEAVGVADRRARQHVPAPSPMVIIKKPMHITYLLTECLHYLSTWELDSLVFMTTLLCRDNVRCLCVVALTR